MDIGTAKPSREIIASVKHWLIDCLDPSELYSVYHFANDAASIIQKLHSEGKTGLLCGGTGLYLRGLMEGIGIQEESDPALKEMLIKRAQHEGSITLHNELFEKDPVSAQKIHPNDLQRIIRALLVFYQTGVPFSSLRQVIKKTNNFEYVIVKFTMERDLLYNRINSRVDEMVKAGLYDEFEELCRRGYHEKSPGLQCVGYRELFPVTRNDSSIKDAIELIKQNTRRFAKRQVTWFSHQTPGMEIVISDDGGDQVIKKVTKIFLDNYLQLNAY